MWIGAKNHVLHANAGAAERGTSPRATVVPVPYALAGDKPPRYVLDSSLRSE